MPVMPDRWIRQMAQEEDMIRPFEEKMHGQGVISMAQAGRVTEDQRQTFFAAGEWMHRELGAEAVLLGGTDLFLAFEGQNCGFPVVDCASIHMDAIYHRALD